MYPILVPPDTDAVPQCMAPANLRKTGQRIEYPILAWDTTGEGQREYELQFAPYNSERWITFQPTENPATLYSYFSPDLYYKARVRSRCHHTCPIHNTWTWSPWSDTILFYTGPTEPDTTASISPVEADGEYPFTLAPNPATGMVTVSWELGEQLSLTLTDASGREVLRMPMPAGQTTATLDVSHLPKGIYLVTLTTSAATGTQRLVVR